MTTKRELLPKGKKKATLSDSDSESSEDDCSQEITPIEGLLDVKKSKRFNENMLMPSQAAKLWIVALSGEGKTCLIINIILKYLLNYEKLWIFSKTIRDDDYQALLNWFRDLAVKIKKDISQLIYASDTLTEFPVLGNKDTLDLVDETKYTTNEQVELIGYLRQLSSRKVMDELEPISAVSEVLNKKSKVKLIDPSRYVDPRRKHLIIVDDFGEDPILKSAAFLNFIDDCRHDKVQILIVQHSLFSAPMAKLRSKFQQFVLFSGTLKGDQKINQAYELMGQGVTRECFRELYKYATSKEHGFMYIDTKICDPNLRFRQSLFTSFPKKLIERDS